MSILRICVPGAGVSPVGQTSEISWPQNALFPIFSDDGSWYASDYLEDDSNDAKCQRGQESFTRLLKIGSLTPGADQLPVPFGNECRTRSPLPSNRPLTFSEDSHNIVLLHSVAAQIEIMSIGKSVESRQPVSVPKLGRGRGGLPGFQRSAMAAVELPGNSQKTMKWRFAWMVPQGVAVADTELGTKEPTAKPIYDAPLFTGLDNAYQLRYSPNGNFLTLVTAPFFGSPPRLRVWDLSHVRQDQIMKMGTSELLKEACRVAAFDPAPVDDQSSAGGEQVAGNALVKAEQIAWFGSSKQWTQPCHADDITDAKPSAK